MRFKTGLLILVILITSIGCLRAADAGKGPLLIVRVSPTLASYHYVLSDWIMGFYKNKVETIKDLKQQFKQPDDVYVTESNLCCSHGNEWVLADDVSTQRYKELFVILDFEGERKKAIKKMKLRPIARRISDATELPCSEDGVGGIVGIIAEYALEN